MASTWGGIGEGLTAGMNARIALEMQERERLRQQANADRAFQFQQEQAQRAQANADRTFSAGREDAATAQANAEADRAMKQKALDASQANADRDFGLKREEMALKTDLAEAELGLKREAQDWENLQNEEKLRNFRLANEKLDREERQARDIDKLKRDSGCQQLATAFYRVTSGGGQDQTITINENGQQVEKKVRVLPQSAREQIFGTDGYFKDVQNVVSFEDENGNTVAALVRPDGTMQIFSPEQQYDIYASAYGKAFADEQRGVSDKKDLGLFTAKEEAKANASAKATATFDPYNMKRKIDAAQTVVRAYGSASGDVSDEQYKSALQFLASVYGDNGNEGELARLKEEREKRAKKRITVPTK